MDRAASRTLDSPCRACGPWPGLILDQKAKLVLMDCGAWIEFFKSGGGQKRPNRQLGAVCGSDLRIYQVD